MGSTGVRLEDQRREAAYKEAAKRRSKPLPEPSPNAWGVKKAARKKVQRMKQPGAPAVETVVIDVIEKPAPDVITITEFEETEVSEGDSRSG